MERDLEGRESSPLCTAGRLPCCGKKGSSLLMVFTMRTVGWHNSAFLPLSASPIQKFITAALLLMVPLIHLSTVLTGNELVVFVVFHCCWTLFSFLIEPVCRFDLPWRRIVNCPVLLHVCKLNKSCILLPFWNYLSYWPASEMLMLRQVCICVKSLEAGVSCSLQHYFHVGHMFGRFTLVIGTR